MCAANRSIADTLASSGGAVLGGLFSVAARIRPTAKPLHPRGKLLRADVTRTGLDAVTGVPWLDEPGDDQALVRVSRAIGLPDRLPDVRGLAVRVFTADGGFGDLLLATTGVGRSTRYLLLPRTSAQRPHTTLLPYRTPGGPLLLGALPTSSPARFDLVCASPRGSWRRFGSLRIGTSPTEPDPDPLMAFDPMLNTLRGLTPYEWVRHLRERAYAAARDSRM
jgi:hypothetical protein